MDCVLLKSDRLESLPESVARKRAVGRDIDEVRFLSIELLELLSKPLPHLLLRSLALFQSDRDLLLDASHQVRWDALGGEVRSQGCFDLRNRQVRQIAEALLSASAEEVRVDVSVPTLRLHEYQPAPVAAYMAAFTEEEAFEEVMVRDVSLTAPRPFGEDILNFEEQFLRHQRFVTTWIQLPFVANNPGVIRVAEHEVELTHRDGSCFPAGRRSRGEPLFREFFVESADRVVAGPVDLKRPLHQRRTLLVDHDRVDEATVEIDPLVAVSKLRAANGAAAHRLVPKLHLDVFTALTDLHLVHNVRHGFHRVGHVANAEVLLCGDELDVHIGQDPFGDRGVSLVTERTSAHVGDHVANFGVLLKEPQHPSELRTFGNRLR